MIAGASRGLGLLIARELVDQGYSVHICARDADELDRAESDLVGRGGTVTTEALDVRDATRVAEWVHSRYPDGSAPDVAIHVAGVIQVGPWDAVDQAMIDECVDTMTKGPSYLALAVVPLMKAAGRGRIGIVSSIGGIISVPHLVPYSVAKFGAAGLAYGLHAELSGTGVTCSAICPPPMRTGSHGWVIGRLGGRTRISVPSGIRSHRVPDLTRQGTGACRANNCPESKLELRSEIMSQLFDLAFYEGGSVDARLLILVGDPVSHIQEFGVSPRHVLQRH